MKKSLTLLLLLLPGFLFSQVQEIKGVLGVEFGSTKQQIIQIMKSKGYTQDPGDKKNVSFDNVKYGALSKCYVMFYLINDKMYQGLILHAPTLESQVLEVYNTINADLSKKYGEGEPMVSFKYPYEEGDGHEITAIKLGKAEYNTFWMKGTAGVLNTYISPNAVVCIKYQDPILIKEAIKEKDAKNLNDY